MSRRRRWFKLKFWTFVTPAGEWNITSGRRHSGADLLGTYHWGGQALKAPYPARRPC